jgi:hypothetical protein
MYLLEAKKRLPVEQPGKMFTAYIVGECRMATSRAYELIAIAEGRTTIEEIRAKQRERRGRFDSKNKAARNSVPNGKTKADPGEESGDTEIASPAVLEDNILHVIGSMNENARVFNKLLKISVFDREAVTRVNTAIDRMIGKWRSIQSTLEKKVASATKPAPSEPTEDDSEDGGNSATDQWERSLGNMAGDAISIRAFWDKTFGKEWKTFEVPSTAVTLAKQAAQEWTWLADDLIARRKAVLN